jgi:predicted glycoside hydrolase/deacetylase ChbG (UPF0249 family)
LPRLIVNAYDFGFSPGVNAGVRLAHEAGALRSATLLAAGEAFDEAVDIARCRPGLGVGCHLALAGMPALCDPGSIPTLAGPDGSLRPTLGSFLGPWIRGRIRLEEVRRELAAQIEKVLAAGIRPTHVDGHKHVLALPGVLGVALALCREHGIPAVRAPFDADPAAPGLADGNRPGAWRKQWLSGRALRLWRGTWQRRRDRAGVAAPERFHGVAFTGFWTQAYLERVVAKLPDGGVTELMTHPAVLDDSLRRGPTRLKESREEELRLLVDVLPGLLRTRGVECCNFGIFREKDQ